MEANSETRKKMVTKITKTKARDATLLKKTQMTMKQYVAIKDESNKDKATTLVTYMNKNDKWIIDSGCSHHMTGDKSKFTSFTQYDGNSVRFGNNAPCLIKGKGSIRHTEKI